MIMTQEDKQLLLKDLSARLPYGVIVTYKSRESEGYISLGYGNIGYVVELSKGWWTDCKPYLRSMTSMTEEEEKELYKESYVDYDCEFQSTPTLALEHCHLSTDWLNAHHFDYRGLIKKGLAIEITSENNPYK